MECFHVHILIPFNGFILWAGWGGGGETPPYTLLTLPTCAFGVTGNSVVSCYTPADPSSNSETP